MRRVQEQEQERVQEQEQERVQVQEQVQVQEEEEVPQRALIPIVEVLSKQDAQWLEAMRLSYPEARRIISRFITCRTKAERDERCLREMLQLMNGRETVIDASVALWMQPDQGPYGQLQGYIEEVQTIWPDLDTVDVLNWSRQEVEANHARIQMNLHPDAILASVRRLQFLEDQALEARARARR